MWKYNSLLNGKFHGPGENNTIQYSINAIQYSINAALIKKEWMRLIHACNISVQYSVYTVKLQSFTVY